MRGVTLLFGVFAPLMALARPFPLSDVPPDLVPWVPFLLDEVPDRACVSSEGRTVCVWPSYLALSLTGTGGTFLFDVTADREARVGLPGGPGAWPEGVIALGGTQVVVLESEGRPYAVLQPGTVRLAGRFVWPSLPESLPVPADVARIELSVDGQAIPFPHRDDKGLLWLRARGGAEGDSLDVEVYRKVSDGVPPTVTTRVVMRVSGGARELDLRPAILPGTIPISVKADVPFHMDANGSLRVKARSGTFKVEVLARAGTLDRLAFEGFGPPWPEVETWVFEADPSLRQVKVSGPVGVDPSRTALPEEWRRLPAYQVEAGKGILFETLRRGEGEPPPPSLALERDYWLDVAGGGWTVRDRIEGRLGRSWRLNLSPPLLLGHVRAEGADQLVTQDPKTGLRGVELRRSDVKLEAESRIEEDIWRLPAVGWSEDMNELKARLHLAPGWRILGATGVDRASDTWLERWTLLSFLFVLLVCLAFARLTRWYVGLLAFITLALNQHETDDPSWAFVLMLAIGALLRVVPEGRFGSLCRAAWTASIGVLALAVAPFIVSQVRHGLYPQARASGLTLARMETTIGAALNAELTRSQQAQEEDKPYVQKAQEPQQLGKKRQSLETDPNAIIQTGPGLPEWSFEQVNLYWNGPVEHTHEFRLYLLSPFVNLLLSIVRVVLTLILVLVTLRLVRGVSMPGGAAAAGAAVLVAMTLPARADVPPRALLDDLKARLLRPEVCEPDCLSTTSLKLSVRERVLELRAEIHAGRDSAWPVPGPVASFAPDSITLWPVPGRVAPLAPAPITPDGRTRVPAALLSDGFVYVRIPPGRHQVVVTGPLSDTDTLTLDLQRPPQRVEVNAAEWEIEGLGEEGRTGRSLRLKRREEVSGRQEALQPWLLVTRTIDFGIPWLVHTRVHRASPIGSPLFVRVPLLQGESVTESGVRVEGGQVVVSLGQNDQDVAWESTLKEQPTITLTAPKDVPWAETWIVRCSPIWECHTMGLSPVSHQQHGRYEPVFRPYPGETLTISLDRPQGAPGQAVTIDRADLELDVGTRLSTAALKVMVRSSQGGPISFNLPEESRLQRVTVNAKEMSVREEGGMVSLSLAPGAQQIELRWQQSGGLETFFKTPPIRLGAVAANATVTVRLSKDRWLIALGGPRWGPALLFWGRLVFVILAGLLLSRLSLSPLSAHQWALLAAGLALVPLSAALTVAGYFFAMQWRATRPQPGRPFVRDSVQIVLGLWSILALGCLYAAVHTGLLLDPDMQVAGAGSHSGHLVWIADRCGQEMPRCWVMSLPRLAWQGVMLAWSLWLAASLIGWLRWAWRCFSTGGLWTPLRRKVTLPPSSQ